MSRLSRIDARAVSASDHAYTGRMDLLAHHLLAHAFNNAWANHRLLGACDRLSQGDFAAERVGFFPSIRATLNHLLTVDWYYIDAIERSLRGDPPNPGWMRFFEPEVPFGDCAGLAAEQARTDRRLIDVCRTLDARRTGVIVQVPRRTGIDREPLHRLLAHLFEHQTHHRGQAHAMLSGTPVAPPQLDEFFGAGDAPRRVADFAALGITEAMVWSGSGISDTPAT